VRAENEYMTLTEIAKFAPGRPSINTVWRWCRKGVIARDTTRVRLQHIRVGGTLYSTAGWFEDFGKRLADADAKYFTDPSTEATAVSGAESPTAVG